MEEDIKILEKFTKIVKGKDYNAKNGWHGYYDDELRVLGKAIDNLIKGYKLEKLKNVLDEQSLKEALEDYIPKSKIQENIEELEEIKNIFAIDKPQYKAELSYAIRVLQELLKEE